MFDKSLETEAWQDLASVYAKLGSFPDAELCLNKAKSLEFFSPRGWHAAGMYESYLSLMLVMKLT